MTPAVSARALREAEQWLGRLDAAGASPVDQETFQRWRAHPEHAAAYEQVERFWHSFDAFPGHPEAARLIAQTAAETAPGRRRRLPFALAASLAVCVVAASAFLAGQYYVPAQTYVTAFGQRSTVQLEDGSRIVLNSDTRLKVRLGKDKRRILLREGEAVFTVAADPQRPFVVSAGDGLVTALGTQFQVRRHSEHVVVTLVEGRIAVDREAARQHLKLEPGEQVRFVHDDPALTRRSVDTETLLGWTTGRLRFDRATLAELLAEVNRYSRTKIVLEDPALAATPISATLEMGNIQAAVTALEALLPVEAAPRGSERIVVTRRYLKNAP